MSKPPEPKAGEVTRLLRRLTEGDVAARDRIWELLHAELRRVAGGLMKGEAPGHSLSPTAVVSEAAVRLVGREPPDLRNRRHFLAIAARVMRRVLVEHARARDAQRRGGDWQRVTLTDSGAIAGPEVDVLDLHVALERLAERDGRSAHVVELKWFGGMTDVEVAAELGVSERTVRSDWLLARAWLLRELGADGAS